MENSATARYDSLSDWDALADRDKSSLTWLPSLRPFVRQACSSPSATEHRHLCQGHTQSLRPRAMCTIDDSAVYAVCAGAIEIKIHYQREGDWRSPHAAEEHHVGAGEM